jgi:hypothetical protein
MRKYSPPEEITCYRRRQNDATYLKQGIGKNYCYNEME